MKYGKEEIRDAVHALESAIVYGYEPAAVTIEVALDCLRYCLNVQEERKDVTREEKDKQRQILHDMAESIKASDFIAPEVGRTYLHDYKNYRCIEVSKQLDDRNGDITIMATFRHKNLRPEEVFGKGEV